jgi:GNAT superfamily N-acetyltransferase
MSLDSINVRTARPEDISSIFSLVKELAIYEHAEHEVLIDEDYYREAFTNRIFEAIVATDNDRIIGMCLYYTTFSTWKGKMLYLEDFVVKEAYRQKGVGQLLYDKLVGIAKAEGYKLMKWQVLDWNEPAIKFYEKNQASIEKEWWNCKIIF